MNRQNQARVQLAYRRWSAITALELCVWGNRAEHFNRPIPPFAISVHTLLARNYINPAELEVLFDETMYIHCDSRLVGGYAPFRLHVARNGASEFKERYNLLVVPIAELPDFFGVKVCERKKATIPQQRDLETKRLLAASLQRKFFEVNDHHRCLLAAGLVHTCSGEHLNSSLFILDDDSDNGHCSDHADDYSEVTNLLSRPVKLKSLDRIVQWIPPKHYYGPLAYRVQDGLLYVAYEHHAKLITLSHMIESASRAARPTRHNQEVVADPFPQSLIGWILHGILSGVLDKTWRKDALWHMTPHNVLLSKEDGCVLLEGEMLALLGWLQHCRRQDYRRIGRTHGSCVTPEYYTHTKLSETTNTLTEALVAVKGCLLAMKIGLFDVHAESFEKAMETTLGELQRSKLQLLKDIDEIVKSCLVQSPYMASTERVPAPRKDVILAHLSDEERFAMLYQVPSSSSTVQVIAERFRQRLEDEEQIITERVLLHPFLKSNSGKNSGQRLAYYLEGVR